jgi:anti-sigma regulatory factor (Ser/Thr protein kinase)
MRNAVTELARHWVPEDRLDDVALVTSELLTNALQHGADDTDIVTEVFAHDDTFVVEITNVIAAQRPPPMSMWRIAGADRSRGRGLGIVHRLASQIDLRSDDGTVTVSVTWPREKR